jgi:DNA-binding protein HU-beta
VQPWAIGAGVVVTPREAAWMEQSRENDMPTGRAIDAPNRIARNPRNERNRTRRKLAETHGVSKAQAKSIVDDIMKNILDAAASGAEVSLPGFGKFKIKATPEREGRNPANGEKIKIAASKKLTFSSAKSVKDLLNR